MRTTFDNLPDLTIVANQLPGVSFTGAQVLTRGSSLNSKFFPPVSDPKVVYDFLNGTITATFAPTPTGEVPSVGAFVTGNTSITETIFSGSTLLGSVPTGGRNFVGADTGIPTNIFLSISGTGITSAVFTNNLGTGNTFTLDNFTFAWSDPSPVSGPTAGDPSPPVRRPRTHRRCRTARPNLGERWSSRLVATTAEDRLSFRHNPHASSRQVSDDRSNTNGCLEKFLAAEMLEVGFLHPAIAQKGRKCV
jgi:hypothetical protein